MNRARDRDASTCGLWSFSLDFYERAGVATALIALQDEAEINVNLVLFAVWLGLSGRGRLDKEAVAEAERAIGSISAEVIEPLRTLRRRLRMVSDTDIQCLRESIKAIEIDAERAAQARLAALAPPPSEADPSQRQADAETNLMLYLGLKAATNPHGAIV
ncbi:MAG: TIGR02444 family protein, partial [Alphaproteobacteria bacterium]|nr:TIGR02444 family protein [Alphaproteobacteria bacterium]